MKGTMVLRRCLSFYGHYNYLYIQCEYRSLNINPIKNISIYYVFGKQERARASFKNRPKVRAYMVHASNEKSIFVSPDRHSVKGTFFWRERAFEGERAFLPHPIAANVFPHLISASTLNSVLEH